MTDRWTCAGCGEWHEGAYITLTEDWESKGEKAPPYCSVRCVENAIESAGMAAAQKALR